MPPIECIELAVEPRLGWYLPLDPGLLNISASAIMMHVQTPTDLGNGYSPLVGDGDIGERLSTECRGAGEAMIGIACSEKRGLNQLCAQLSGLQPPPTTAQSMLLVE